MQSLPSELARSTLDAAPDAMIILDDSGVIRFANRQVSALFGHSHDELIGRPVEHLMPVRFRGQHPSMRQAYMRNVRVRPMGAGLSLFGLRQDGTEFPVEISLSPIDADGRNLVAAAIRDVTDRKRVEAELSAQLEHMRRLHEMSAQLIEAADLPKMLEEVLDATIAVQRADYGNIQLWEPETGVLKIVAQHGFSSAFLEHFASVDINEPSACGRALRAGERVIIEDVQEDPDYLPHRAIAAQEGYRAVQSSPILGREGVMMGMFSTHFREPHRPSERELQITDVYIRLVSSLITRAQGEEMLRAARDVANRANQAKSRFLATASHDLRQPLQTLALLTGTLRRVSTNATADEALAQQELAIRGMSRLLNPLLDISKLEAGAIKPDPTDFTVSALFDELRREFADLASNKGLTLEVTPCDDSVHSDPSLVGQILRNLVSNAIKYTRAGCVALRCLHDLPSYVSIEVLDTGIGIPPDKLHYIYDEFYQVGVPSNTTREGYGLGLSIVQRLVMLLDLKLDVESEVGKGSKFALRLPVSSEVTRPTRHIAPKSKSGTSQGEARVLLLEDDPAVRNATRMLLRSEGYQVTAVGTVAEALEQARADPRIDLLVTDYHLNDGETGTQAILALRAALARPLKAVLITGDTSSAVKELPRDPLLRFASKPIEADELLAMFRALMDS